MRDLALADLHLLDDAPRIRDLDLAEALGFEQARSIRVLMERNRPELETHGRFCIEVMQNPAGEGRPLKTYWLSEPQALLICMFARTARAAEVRRQVIAVYMAWRRGKIAAAARALPALPPPRPAYPLEDAARRLGPVETQALALALAPVWKNGRRPAYWSDFDVRTLIVETHRQMTIAEARAICTDRYGPARTPSRSAVHRLWMALDAVRACPTAA